MNLSAVLTNGHSQAATQARSVGPRALGAADFRRVAENGFGDGSNSYAYSAAWYNNHLYVGSNRDILPLLIMRSPFKIPFAVPPVPLPNDYTDLDLRGQIWRYNVERDEWKRVYHAPLIEGYQGRLAPQAFGFRAMAVFQGASDPGPAIYTIPAVGRNVLESVTLRSTDGETFQTLPAPRVRGSNDVYGSFRAMCVFKGRLFVAPSASKGRPEALRVEDGKEVHITHANTSTESAVLCSADPVSGEWELSSPPLFGDLTNASIIDMTVCGDYLYVGTLNVRHGFQLWRTLGEGPAPHHWELVLDRGADRGGYNQAVLSMASYRGDLYIGTCIQNGGYDRVYQIGPAAGEVLRVRSNGTWDLVVGDPRLTRHGLKTPTSGLRAGFNNPMAGYIWRMCVHDDVLYAGTCDISSFVPFSAKDTWPQHVQRLLDADSMERFMDRLGGCELWRTTDGDNWLPVTRNGFGNRYNLGVRALISTPHGLFAGTANPFGPRVAVRDGDGWRYQDNPRGGLEMWLGQSKEDTLANEPLAVRGAQRLHLAGANGSTASTASNGAAVEAGSSRFASPAPKQLISQSDALEGNYRLLERELVDAELLRNPFLRLSSTPEDLVGLSETVEQELDEYFDYGPRNVGYWRHRSLRPADAVTGLVDELCALVPAEEVDEGSTALVVADGGSNLAARAAERLPAAAVRGETIEAWPAAPPGGYDLVLAIEPAAQQTPAFLTRLAAALKPGGCAMICGHDWAAADQAGCRWQAEIEKTNLQVETVRDVTSSTWTPFFEHTRNFWLVKLLLQQIDSETHAAILAALPGGNAGVRGYAIVRLRKSKDA